MARILRPTGVRRLTSVATVTAAAWFVLVGLLLVPGGPVPPPPLGAPPWLALGTALGLLGAAAARGMHALRPWSLHLAMAVAFGTLGAIAALVSTLPLALAMAIPPAVLLWHGTRPHVWAAYHPHLYENPPAPP